jgi:hypothetical protein
MPWLFVVAWLAIPQVSAPPASPVNVSALKFGRPVAVAELDLGKLNGELRRLSWNDDGTQLYVQTASRQSDSPVETPHHYLVALDVPDAVKPVAAEPAWAVEYWNHKQDRDAPGIAFLSIQVVQKTEVIKTGPGNAGALSRTGDPSTSAGTLDTNGASGQDRVPTVRLSLLGEEIAAWINERPVIPGMKFGWGPFASGALVYLGENGQMVFLDRQKHRQRVPDVKDAQFPAWSMDGSRLAYVQKTARKKYTLSWLAVSQ